jgi:hypothetical protein
VKPDETVLARTGWALTAVLTRAPGIPEDKGAACAAVPASVTVVTTTATAAAVVTSRLKNIGRI